MLCSYGVFGFSFFVLVCVNTTCDISSVMTSTHPIPSVMTPTHPILVMTLTYPILLPVYLLRLRLGARHWIWHWQTIRKGLCHCSARMTLLRVRAKSSRSSCRRRGGTRTRSSCSTMCPLAHSTRTTPCYSQTSTPSRPT